MDAQAKAWYLRGKSPLKDGVLALTATPVTNSPLEIYSMLSLSVGHDRLNDLCLGTQGADDFMNLIVEKQNQDDVSIDGVARAVDVFVGLKNVGILRSALGDVAVIKSAKDVGAQIVVPDKEEIADDLALPQETVDTLKLYKEAFRFAVDTLGEKSNVRGSKEAFEAVSDKFGETLELVGHPFNLINKMSLLIADPELDQRATFYLFDKTDAARISMVVEQFNALAITEERSRPGPMTNPDAVVNRKSVLDKETGKETVTLKIAVRALVDTGNNRVVIDTMDSDTQARFVDMAEKAGVGLDVTVSPKLSSLLKNVQKEQATPRGVDDEGKPSPIVKQIVFCDVLALHTKIKLLLSKRAGIPTSQIAIITGRINNTPEQIIDVQNGFNAQGEDNRFRLVVANEKAEVGINLQRGTQAIHHLTIGWTPDSLTQRNGRGVRQGNKTERVTVYYYDANGTFDSYKRAMVNKKSDWIDDVLNVNGGESVAVTGGLSREQMEALIESVGDSDAITRIQESALKKDAENRALANRSRQEINLDTIIKQRAFIDTNDNVDTYIAKKVLGLWEMQEQIQKLTQRKSGGVRLARSIDDLKARVDELRKQIEASATFNKPLDEIRDSWYVSRQKTEDGRINAIIYNGELKQIEGGPIGAEWNTEVILAQSMINESLNSFVIKSKADGGLPPSIAKEFSEGKGWMKEGVPIVDGTFLRSTEGYLSVAFNKKIIPYSTGKIIEAIYPGNVGYDTVITEAAKIEDDEANRGETFTFYSDIIPEVAERRKTESVASYYIYSYLLPSPYFPFVIDEDNAKDSAVQRAIFEEQKVVVKSITNRKFTVPISVQVIPNKQYDNTQKNKALIEYAKAHPGLNLSPVDTDLASIEFNKEFTKALTGNTEDKILSSAKIWLEQTMPWFDWGLFKISDLPYSYRAEVNLALNRIFSGIADMPATLTPEEPQKEPLAKVAIYEEPQKEPSAKVAIYGDTFRWKEEIKDCGRSTGGFDSHKEFGKFKGWVLTRAGWDCFKNKYPNAAKKMIVKDWS
ncbi:hypothetical protein CCP3SC15_1900005 [Gammaproteobacteria bacterium]